MNCVIITHCTMYSPFCVTLAMTLCDMHDSLWCSQGFCIPSQWLRYFTTSICILTMTLHDPQNDTVFFHKDSVIFTMTIYHHHDRVTFTMTMRVFTKNFCDLIVTYVPSKMTYEAVCPHNECVPSQWLCDLHHVVVYPHNNDSDNNSGFTVTLCDFTMIVWTLIMSSCALTITMSEFHNDCNYYNISVWLWQWLCAVLPMTLCSLTMTSCVLTMTVWLHNDGMTSTMTLWISPWLFDLISDSVCPHKEAV